MATKKPTGSRGSARPRSAGKSSSTRTTTVTGLGSLISINIGGGGRRSGRRGGGFLASLIKGLRMALKASGPGGSGGGSGSGRGEAPDLDGARPGSTTAGVESGEGSGFGARASGFDAYSAGNPRPGTGGRRTGRGHGGGLGGGLGGRR